MFNWIFGSSHDIKTNAENFLKGDEAHWKSFESSNKDLKKERINDVVRSLWGENKPFLDFFFFGFIASRRTSKVQKVLKSYLAEKKISLLKNLEQEGQKLTDIGNLNNPVYRIFKTSELHLFSNVNIPSNSLPEDARNWSSRKKELVVDVFASHWIPTASIHALLQKTPEELRSALNAFKENQISSMDMNDKKNFASVILHLHFFPALKSILPSTLKACLAGIEKTKAFDSLVQDIAKIGFKDSVVTAAETGADVQKSMDEKMKSFEEDNSSSYLKVTFHQPDDTEDGSSLYLQHLLQQYAYTRPLQSIGNALNFALDTSMFTISEKNKELQVDVRKLDDSIKVEYTYRGALTSAMGDNDLERGEFTGRFSYQLNRDESGKWKIEGPEFEPLNLSY